jgi:hypothetical protein
VAKQRVRYLFRDLLALFGCCRAALLRGRYCQPTVREVGRAGTRDGQQSERVRTAGTTIVNLISDLREGDAKKWLSCVQICWAMVCWRKFDKDGR